jgi:hypothetical protein
VDDFRCGERGCHGTGVEEDPEVVSRIAKESAYIASDRDARALRKVNRSRNGVHATVPTHRVVIPV